MVLIMIDILTILLPGILLHRWTRLLEAAESQRRIDLPCHPDRIGLEILEPHLKEIAMRNQLLVRLVLVIHLGVNVQNRRFHLLLGEMILPVVHIDAPERTECPVPAHEVVVRSRPEVEIYTSVGVRRHIPAVESHGKPQPQTHRLIAGSVSSRRDIILLNGHILPDVRHPFP